MATFQGKVIAVTGAASGIARATSFVIAERGATLALADSNQEGLEAVATEISKLHAGISISTKVVNVAKSDEVDAWLDEVVKQFGKLDGALNAAGIIGAGFGETTIEELTNEQWDVTMDVNLRGTFYCLRAELQRMLNGNGSIVNMASAAGLIGVKWGAPYCVTKHGVIGLTKSAAKEVGSRNIRVNAIAPGAIDTPMLKTARSSGRHEEGLASRFVLERLGTADEVAKLIAFLLSDDSSYITATVVPIDGGYTA